MISSTNSRARTALASTIKSGKKIDEGEVGYYPAQNSRCKVHRYEYEGIASTRDKGQGVYTNSSEMVPTLIAYLGSALLAWSVWVSISLAKNYRTARSIGLPVVICPVTSLNPLWIIGYRLFPLVLKLRHLPFGLGRWVRSSYFGWNFVEKHAIHDELGDIFAIASPSSIEVVVADPQAAHAIFSRRKDFIKPALLYDQLNLFGRNLDTVEGEDWQRHRKLTAPSFNERTSSLVWDEASRQAKAMLDAWCRLGAKGTRETVRDTATLALHVLTSAGLGVTYEWGQGVQHLPPGHTMSYRESLSVCLQNVLPLNIFSKRVLALNFMPSKTQKIGRALQEFQLYMDEMLAHERSSAAKQSRSWNLMGALVRASEDSDHSLEGKETKHRLTDEEVFGNIFIYNFAGHETTANTVAFALVLLAAYPQYQDWLSEEIHTVVGNSPEEALQYEIVFPKFHRCLAVMVRACFEVRQDGAAY